MQKNSAPKGFRAQIVGSKRQMTVPIEIMKYYRLQIGDFLEFFIEEGRLRAEPLKLMPVSRMSPEQLTAIDEGRAEYERGEYKSFESVDAFVNDAEARKIAAGKSDDKDQP
jgi:bifunctional DNA-binding transcriptional regulator/antitoxin component of YhaV-PrlF toxin-antitoxin module